MTEIILLSEAQMARISPFFPLSHGVPRVDDRRIISGIIFVIRNGLAERDVEVCTPLKSNRKTLIPFDRTLYRKRHKIENMFVKIKDWRCIHTRYDRCAHSYMSAIAIAAIGIFWI